MFTSAFVSEPKFVTACQFASNRSKKRQVTCLPSADDGRDNRPFIQCSTKHKFYFFENSFSILFLKSLPCYNRILQNLTTKAAL